MGNELCFNCDTPIRECECMSKCRPVPGWTARIKKCKCGFTYSIKACPKRTPPKNMDERKVALRVCPVCGKVYEQKIKIGPRRKYCSEQCKNKAYELKRKGLLSYA
ncbi:MAG: hypothetical protein IJD83_06545 [Clostridia bacterium]|nr:hypothetical protein [Clostridia bacterium]